VRKSCPVLQLDPYISSAQVPNLGKVSKSSVNFEVAAIKVIVCSYFFAAVYVVEVGRRFYEIQTATLQNEPEKDFKNVKLEL